MEDYQEQEYEFFRKLDDQMDRRRLLKRGLAAGAGLTILSVSEPALAIRQRIAATPPLHGTDMTMKDLVAAAKKEGHVNLIALPPDWANYGGLLKTWTKKYGIAYTDDIPDGSSAQENQAIVSLKGDPRAPDCVDVSPTFAVQGANTGLYSKYFPTTYKSIPRKMKDTRGYWNGDYYGVISIGSSGNLVKNAPKSFKDLLKPEYKNQVALNGSPLTSGSAIAGVLAASIANGGSLSDVGPGIDFFAQLKKIGNFIPVQGTPQTVATGQTPIVIDWDYLNIAYAPEFPAVNWKTNIPADGIYGGYYCQAINSAPPHPFAARLWQEFVYSDQGQILYLQGFAHPARFDDLAARKVIPAALVAKLPAPAAYAKVKFASLGQLAAAKAKITAEWQAKVG